MEELIAKAAPAPITSIGYVLYEDDDVVLLAATIDEDHELCGNATFLLKMAIVSINDLSL